MAIWDKTLRLARLMNGRESLAAVVYDIGEDGLTARILPEKFQPRMTGDLLSVFQAGSYEELLAFRASGTKELQIFPWDQVLPPAPGTGKVICAGTNFYSLRKTSRRRQRLSLFAKICHPSASFSQLAMPPIELLDFGAELGLVFADDIRQPSDMESMLCGFFVANDLNAACIRILKGGISGCRGAGEARSIPGFLPLGPVIAVPRPSDRRDFLSQVQVELRVNGELRQKVSVHDMIYSPRDLMDAAFAFDGRGHSCDVRGSQVSLLTAGCFPRGTLLLTGCSPETALQVPGFLARGSWTFRGLLPGAGITGLSLVGRARLAFIQHEKRTGRYLQKGDVVEASVAGLGVAKSVIF